MMGMDIYRYQTVTDWQAVKRHGIKYAWRKLTDGGGPAASRGDAQVRGLKLVGIPVGGYHYAQLSPTPEVQAAVFLAEVKRLGAEDLVPMLDLEAPFTPGSAARAFGERFCRRVKQLGYQPGVYMNNSFAKVLRPDQWDTNPVIWIARYGADPDYGGPVDIHQYTSAGLVPGIGGSVDLNWANTTRHFANTNTGVDDMELFDRFDEKAVTEHPGTVGHTLLNIKQNAHGARAEIAGLTAAVGRLAEAVATNSACSPAELKQAVMDGMAESINVNLTVGKAE